MTRLAASTGTTRRFEVDAENNKGGKGDGFQMFNAVILRFGGFFASADGLAPCIGQTANQPVGFDGVVYPGFGPAFADTGLDGLRVYGLAVAVEERQLSAGLADSAT